MTPEIAFILALVLAAAALLISDRLRPDLVALLMLVVLGLTGLVPPETLFSGFSRQAVITVLALFIITAGLERTGVTRWLGQVLGRLAGASEGRVMLVIMLATALLSLVMNTIAAAAVLLPVTIGLARQTGLRPSRLLIPLSFASLLGGMATLFTTANILVSSTLAEHGYQPYGVLDFIPVGLPMTAAGILFLALFGRRWLPEHGPAHAGVRRAGGLSEMYGLAETVSAVYIRPGSAMAGQTLAEGRWGADLGLTVVAISRGGQVRLAPAGSEGVREGDIVLFTGFTDEEEMARYGLVFTEDPAWKGQFASEAVSLVEVTLAPRSSLAGRSLREIHFRDKYDLTAMVLWREGHTLRDGIADLALHFGDALLLLGQRSRISQLREDPDFLVLEEDMSGVEAPWRAWLAVGMTVAAVLLPALNILPIAEATFAAAVVMILGGCLNMEQAYAAVEWKAIFLIAGILPLGTAMLSTGAAAFLGDALVNTLGAGGPLVVAAGLYLGTLLLTQVMSGQATAVVLAPIAVAAAERLRVDPRGLALAVALGCSTAFLTPFSHASNLMVMGPGGYNLRDYTRIGLPLTAVLAVVFVVSLALFWRL